MASRCACYDPPFAAKHADLLKVGQNEGRRVDVVVAGGGLYLLGPFLTGAKELRSTSVPVSHTRELSDWVLSNYRVSDR